jgi:putative hydrolase
VSGTLLDLAVDVHCHTTASDDAHDTLAAVIAAAQARGLTALSITDHVRASTTWLPEYVEQVHRARRGLGLRVTCGVEAKILDAAGRVDLPPHLAGIEQVTISDHQYPGPDGPVRPEDVRRELAEGAMSHEEALEQLIDATARAVSRHQRPVVGHLFSILPKIGVDEALVSDASLKVLADACLGVEAAVEVNEKWATPSADTVARLAALGVRLAAGSDAHRAEDVGRYRYVSDVAHGRAGPGLP